MIKVNGRRYPLWSQFVERKSEWIDGVLEDFGDPFMPCKLMTAITDITLKGNGKKSAFFSVSGKDFSCGFDVSVGGITSGEEGWITFNGYGGHTWRIKSNRAIEPADTTGNQSRCSKE